MKIFNLIKISMALMLVAAPVVALAEMTSTNYTIYADTIGVNGGVFSSSTSYNLQDTFGESPVGVATSTSYEVRGGYQAMERGSLSMSLSSSVVALGQLNASSVSTGSTVVTISSDAPTGYTLSVGAVSGSMPPAVTDGSVSAGSLEYGFTASGTNSVIATDVAVTPAQIISSASSPVVNATTTLTFKASRASNSADATYSQTVTLAASANF